MSIIQGINELVLGREDSLKALLRSRFWRMVQLSHVHQSRLSALRSTHVRSGTVVHLVHGRVGRVGVRRIGIDIAGAVLGRRSHVRR